MIRGASFIGNLFGDARVLPPKDGGSGSTLVAFSVAVSGPGKDTDPTAVDCSFYVSEGKQMPFIVSDLLKGAKVGVIGGDMHLEKGKDGRTYLKCKIGNPYDSVVVHPKQAAVDNSSPF